MGLFPDLSLILAEFLDISRLLEFQKKGNPVHQRPTNSGKTANSSCNNTKTNETCHSERQSRQHLPRVETEWTHRSRPGSAARSVNHI